MKLRLLISFLLISLVASAQNADFVKVNVTGNLGGPVQDTVTKAYKLGEIRTRPQDSLAYRWSGRAWQLILTGISGVTIPSLNTVLSAGNTSGIGINVGPSVFQSISVPSIAVSGQVLMVVVNPNGTFSAQTIPGGTTLINSLNGLTASAQFLKVSFTVATSPQWSDVTATHTLNFPIGSTADTGLVSPAEVTAWNAKWTPPSGGTTAQYIDGTLALHTFPYIPDSGIFTVSGGGIVITGTWPNLNFAVTSTGGITALSGDVVTPGGGSGVATIQPNVVSNTKLAQMAALTFKVNPTSSTANAQDGSIATVKGMLNVVDTVYANSSEDSIWVVIDGRVHGMFYQSGNAGNLPITITLSGDVSGTATSPNNLAVATTVGALLNKTLPALPTSSSILRYGSGAFSWDNNTYVTTTILSDSLANADTITIVPIGTVGWPTVYGSSTKNLYARLLVNSQLNSDSSQVIESAANTYTQTSHGFTVGEPISMTGGAFVAADTNNLAIGIVSRVIDANHFELTYGGYINWTSGLTVNTWYYVTEPAGSLSSTSPNKSQPVLFVVSATQVLVQITFQRNLSALTAIPTLDQVLGQGNVSSKAATVGALAATTGNFSSTLGAAGTTVTTLNASGAVSLTNASVSLPNIPYNTTSIPSNLRVVTQDSTVGGALSHYNAQFINMTGYRNGWVATWDSTGATTGFFYLAQGGSGGGGSPLTMAAVDGQPVVSSAAGGATISSNQLYLQTARQVGATGYPGILNDGTSSQTIPGNKIWQGSIQQWNCTGCELPNIPDAFVAAKYKVVVVDTTNSGTAASAAAEYVNMSGVANNYIPYWNSSTQQFYMSAPPAGTVTGITVGNLANLYTTVTTTGANPTVTFNAIAAGAYTIFGNNTSASAGGAYFVPVLASALFANQGGPNFVLHGATSGNPSWSAVNLSADVTGVTQPGNGGTGLSSYVLGDVLYANGTGLAVLTPNSSTTKMFFTMTGTGSAGTAPVWATLVASDITNGLGYTPENVANKENTVSNSSTAYPTGTAVINYGTVTYLPLVGGTFTGTTGNGYLGLPTQSAGPSITPSSGVLLYSNGNNNLSFFGPSLKSNTFSFSSTASRVYSFPDITDIITTNTSVQTLSNKTLSSPTINFGSDAQGDIIVRGATTDGRLAVGSVGQYLSVVSTNTLGYVTPTPTTVSYFYAANVTSGQSTGIGTSSATGTYRVGGYVTINAIAGSAVLEFTVLYTNENGTVVNLAMTSSFNSTTMSSTGTYYFPPILIRAKTGGGVSVGVTQTAGTVNDFNYDWAEQIEYIGS